MDADAVVIEYLRRKLKGGRDARAEGILKPKMAAEAMPPEEEGPSEESLMELEAMLGEGEDDEELEG